MRDPIETVLICDACSTIIGDVGALIDGEWIGNRCYCPKCAAKYFEPFDDPDLDVDE